MSIVGAIVLPHPPMILPEVGRGREKTIQATIDGCRTAAERLARWRPEATVVLSPHIPAYRDGFRLPPGADMAGDMADFAAPQARLTAVYDQALRTEILRQAAEAGLPADTGRSGRDKLDHASYLSLHFLQEAGVNVPTVRIALSGLPPLAHYRLGQCVRRAADALDKRVAVVASGDLSHKLKADGPYGFAPEGPDFDRQITQAMAQGDFRRFMTFDPAFCDRAAECGLGSFQIMAGALDGLAVQPELLSYQDVTGVGYGVAAFPVTGPSDERRFLDELERHASEEFQQRRQGEDAWVRLARLSLETFVRTGKRLAAPPDELPEELVQRRTGVFVSLHQSGQLRGCIGTIAPVTSSVATEILRNAISAGTEDPRFPPVTARELDSLEYSVDVLGPTEKVNSPGELDVKRYGVIVSRGGRRGLLLPNLDGVDTVEEQIDIARRKGGIGPNEPYLLERFEVVRHL